MPLLIESCAYRLPSGKRLQNWSYKITMENHHAINGKTHYFDWAIFNSYVSLPEATVN